MGLVGILKSMRLLKRDDVEVRRAGVDDGAGNSVEVDVYHPAGLDSQPLVDDYVSTVGDGSSGGRVAVGYVDAKEAPVAAKGETRLYSRKENGDIAAETHLKADGEVVTKNDSATITAKPDGTIELDSGTGKGTIKPDGTVTLDSGAVTLSVKPDGTIELGGAKVDATSIVEATDFKAGLLQFLTHVHTSTVIGTPTSPPIA